MVVGFCSTEMYSVMIKRSLAYVAHFLSSGTEPTRMKMYRFTSVLS